MLLDIAKPKCILPVECVTSALSICKTFYASKFKNNLKFDY